jgi:hypothetical protein
MDWFAVSSFGGVIDSSAAVWMARLGLPMITGNQVVVCFVTDSWKRDGGLGVQVELREQLYSKSTDGAFVVCLPRGRCGANV